MWEVGNAFCWHVEPKEMGLQVDRAKVTKEKKKNSRIE